MQRITIIGLGLMGGSLALALKMRTKAEVWGVDINRAVVNFAIESGAVDRGFTDASEALKDSDFIVISLYPADTREFVRLHADEIKVGALVTDLCGVKSTICEYINSLAGGRFRFIGGHPMAGKERSGFGAADPELFEGCSYIIVPPDGTPEEYIKRLEAFALSIGAARLVRSTPEEHDAMICYTSQLPHIIAAAYVASPVYSRCSGYTAGSFKDVSRVASINEEMWSQLFLENKSKLSAELGLFIENLQKIKSMIDNGDRPGLKEALKEARVRKESSL